MPLHSTRSLHLDFFPNDQTGSTFAGLFKTDVIQAFLPRLFENRDA